jgi:hypothetical protein
LRHLPALQADQLGLSILIKLLDLADDLRSRSLIGHVISTRVRSGAGPPAGENPDACCRLDDCENRNTRSIRFQGHQAQRQARFTSDRRETGYRNSHGSCLDEWRFEREAANSYPNFRQAAMMTVELRKDRTDG